MESSELLLPAVGPFLLFFDEEKTRQSSKVVPGLITFQHKRKKNNNNRAQLVFFFVHFTKMPDGNPDMSLKQRMYDDYDRTRGQPLGSWPVTAAH
jgi:hypothetical protein